MKNEKQGNSKNSVLEEIASLFEKNEQDIQSKRNPDKTYWNVDMVNDYLDKHSGKIILPEDVYCTENFTWNEILMTLNKDISRPSMEILQNLYYLANLVQLYRDKLEIPIAKNLKVLGIKGNPSSKILIQKHRRKTYIQKILTPLLKRTVWTLI